MSLRDDAITAMANGRWCGQWDECTIAEIEADAGAVNVAEDEAASLNGLLDWLEEKGMEQPDFAWIDPKLVALLRGEGSEG